MIKNVILGLALVGWLTACSTDSYKVSGKFDDVTSGTVYLRKVDSFGLTEVDTAKVENGSFVFTGKVEHPELHLIFFEEKRTPILLFLENAKISITGNTEKLDDAVVKGSNLSTIFTKFNKEVPHIDRMEKIRDEFMQAQSLNNEAAMQSIMADYEVIVKEQEEYYLNFVKTNSNNVVGAFIALNMAQSLEYEELVAIVENLEKSVKEHPYLDQLREIIEPMRAQAEAEAALAVGNEAPVFSLVDINGNNVSLDSFRGKYVFLDFWAAWCRPCRIENPVLVEAYKRFGGSDFEIVSVSLDQTVEAWKQAVAEDGLTWTLLHDPLGNTAETYAVQSIPSTWLLDKEGNIIQKELRGEELIQVLEGLLAK
jgi:peroxiredoxin